MKNDSTLIVLSTHEPLWRLHSPSHSASKRQPDIAKLELVDFEDFNLLTIKPLACGTIPGKLQTC
jgi:hypothetical protein